MNKLQIITGIHKVHHIDWSYGYVFKAFDFGYFGKFRFKKVHRSEYHDCTISKVY